MKEEQKLSEKGVKGPFSAGQNVELEITAIAAGGEAIGRYNNFVVFVPYGIPGDFLLVKIIEIKKTFAKGKIERIITSSPNRIEPRCSIYNHCGGCHFQHIDYKAQLSIKKKITQDSVSRIGNLKNVIINDVYGIENPWYYRNKVQVVIGESLRFKKNNENMPVIGLYARKTHKIISMENCFIQNKINNKVLAEVKKLLLKYRWKIYNENSHKGDIRHLISRTNHDNSEVLLTVVSKSPDLLNFSNFAQIISSEIEEIKGVVLNHNPGKTNVILGSENTKVIGNDYINQKIDGIKFRVSSSSFFQVNIEGLKILLEYVKSIIQHNAGKTLIDAYCGVGVFSIMLSGLFRKIYGIEEVKASIDDARCNADKNRISNIVFFNDRVEDRIKDLTGLCDVIILDPPRSGIKREVTEIIAGTKIPTIIYISCNPSTLARDIGILKDHGYLVKSVQPVDMFPQTCQVEAIAKLEYAL